MSLYVHEQLLLTHLIQSNWIPRCVADIIASFAHVRDVCDLMKHAIIDEIFPTTKNAKKQGGLLWGWGFRSINMDNSHLYDFLYDEKGVTYARMEFNRYLQDVGRTLSEGEVMLREIRDEVEKQLHKFICIQKKQFHLHTSL
jgi:hypothetical protein